MHTTQRAVALLTAVRDYADQARVTYPGPDFPPYRDLTALMQACEVLIHLVWQKPSAAEVIETYAARMAEDLELIEREGVC